MSESYPVSDISFTGVPAWVWVATAASSANNMHLILVHFRLGSEAGDVEAPAI